MTRRYPAYKDSGVEWLGEVPEGWVVSKLSRAVDPRRQITYGIVQAGPHYEGGIPYIRPTDMTDESGVIDESTLMLTSPEIVAAYRRSELRSGDLVCSIGPSFGKVMVVPASLNGANLTQGTARLAVALSGNHPRFVFWFLRSPIAVNQWESAIGGATFRSLNLEPLATTRIALPPLPEQTAIADFLDRETAKIDALVAEQRRLIDLLREKRQAVISHAVTKGLNPNAPMKPSGVEWLGDVPEEWEIARLKNDLSFLTSGSRGWAEHYSDDGAVFLRIGNLPREAIKLDLSDIQRVSVPEGSEGQRTRVETGDVLFSITAYLGSVAVVPANLEVAYVSQHVALARLNQARMLPAWVAYVTLSVVGKTYLAEQGYGGTKVQLSLDDVANLIVPVPPKHEQQEILAYLEEQTLKLDTLTAAAEASIVLLQERRAALIFAAVTGKIDVRSEQPATITKPDNQDIRMAVAATIIARLWKMPTFGRVKNQKVVYLAEAYAGIAEFHGNYLREAAGPLDRALLRDLECGLERAGTIAVQQPRGIGTAVTYRFTGDSASIKKTLKMQLGARLERLERLIDAVCDLDTRSIEAVATLYAAWNDILIEGRAPTDDEVVLEVLENWHPEKQVKFTPADLHRWLAWMRRKLIVPDGTGPKTVTGRLFA